MEKKMIWSSEMIYDDEARANYLEDMRAITEDEDYQLTDEEWVEEVYIGLSDERINLDKKIEGVIIAFADLGLWQGRRNAFQIFGDNIANILHTQCEDAEWYGDTYNIRGTLHHHDGTNYVLYRIAKDEETAERIAAKIYNGEIDEKGFRKLTRSLYPDVAKVYGGKLQDKRAWLNLQYSQISKITSMADWRFDKYLFEGNKEAVTKAFQALDSPLKTDRSQWKDANFLRGSPGWLGYIIIELLRNSLDDFLCRGTFRLTSDNIFQMKPGICGFKVEADSTWTPSVSLFQAIAESFGITLYYHSIGEWDDEIIFTNDEDGLVFPELKFTQ